ncbi:MAG: gamma-glutamyl-gamma-aminobutyrate hydrolase family protein [Verrucomicrobiota bacterium]
MSKAPLILISPGIQASGFEFSDRSVSLSEAYTRAIAAAGGVPLVAPTGVDPKLMAACVRSCDGVLLTGGDDVEPDLYEKKLPAKLRKTVDPTPDNGERTLRELVLIDEIFRQRKPTLAICRGSQLMNVALGGTLIVDIPSQVPGAIEHRRLDKRSDKVHSVRVQANSLLAKVTGRKKLDVNSTHHQAVGKIAEPLRPVAVCQDGIIEAVELRPEAKQWLPFFIGVQFHPERLAPKFAEFRLLFSALVKASGKNRTS